MSNIEWIMRHNKVNEKVIQKVLAELSWDYRLKSEGDMVEKKVICPISRRPENCCEKYNLLCERVV